jgi:hypothetical protein
MGTTTNPTDELRCTEQDGPEDFMALNEAVLYENEAANTMTLGWMNRYRLGKPVEQGALFLTIQRGEQPVGYAVQTRAKSGLLVSNMDDAAVDVLVNHLTAGMEPMACVFGPHTVAAQLSTRWTEKHDVQARREMRQGVYRLRTVKPPDRANGRMQQANETMRERITAWEERFIREVFRSEAQVEMNLQNMRQRTIEAERVYFWHDETGTPVCMAAKTRESRNIGYISLVYTPPEHRGKGYASRLCALLSQDILDSGKSFCMLNTDLDNPTSNALYQRIGYEQIGEWAAYGFDADE